MLITKILQYRYINNSDIDIEIKCQFRDLKIYDHAGKEILRYSYQNTNHITITSEDLSPGVYIAELTNSNGEPITKRKFVKPH